MRRIAIIPARGGSKRIPKKNIKEFCGKPIIAYSIEAALKSGLFDTVFVSTDDDEIKSVALKYGAEVPFLRSKENSGDFSSSSDVIVEVLEKLKDKDKIYDIVACIYPTAPFITENKLINAYKLFSASNAKSLVSVVAYSFPPQRSFHISNDRLKLNFPEFNEKRTQDLSDIFHDAGQFYFGRVDSYMKEKRFFSDDTYPFVLPELEVQDIDTNMDWIIAELKYKLLIK